MTSGSSAACFSMLGSLHWHDLRPVDDGGGNYISVIQHDEIDRLFQSGFCRFSGG